MFASHLIRLIAKAACFMSALLIICGLGSGKVFGGCGDYLHHSGSLHISLTRNSLEDLPTNDPAPGSQCRGGNCRSAPSEPPIDPTRSVVVRRQSASFLSGNLDLDALTVLGYGWSNDLLPLSTSLEVITPPPILIA